MKEKELTQLTMHLEAATRHLASALHDGATQSDAQLIVLSDSLKTMRRLAAMVKTGLSQLPLAVPNKSQEQMPPPLIEGDRRRKHAAKEATP